MTHPEHAVSRQRLQVELDLGEEPQRALRPDQQMRHVVAAGGTTSGGAGPVASRATGREVVDVVAAEGAASRVAGPVTSRAAGREGVDVVAAGCATGCAAGPVASRAAVREGVDVVPADPSEQRRETACDLAGFPGPQRAHAPDQIAVAVIARDPCEIARRLGEPGRRPVGEDRADRVHVVHHVAVADGAGAARVVAGHAPDGRPVGR